MPWSADERVGRVLGMARRPFDTAARGWTKTEYRQGDILDGDAVADFVAEADVVVHLAYLIMGSREESRRTNLEGTRNVFEATVAAARPKRLVYTSSVAAYGYHSDNPLPLTEDVPARGSAEHYYSEQKAECEALLHEVTDDTGLEVYVLRPCIVSGPQAPALARFMPWQQLADAAAGCRCGRWSTGCLGPRASSPTLGRRCSWCTTTTWRPRSPWLRWARGLPATTTWPVTAR